MSVSRWLGLVGGLVGIACVMAAAEAQQAGAPAIPAGDSVTVAANARYDLGGSARTLLGDEYRDLWAAPVRVPVLDLGRFAGGLELVEAAGRKQTKSLRFLSADGREFDFRSVDKYPLLARSPALEGTLGGWLIRDQTSALFPAAAVALPPLLKAAGVIHVVPKLAVLPDDERLGEHRTEFAGMLGMIEERPDEGAEDQLRVAGSDLIIGSDRLRERLLEGPEDRVDSRALLTARLLDTFVNDRDRHWEQWRWAGFEREGARFWKPIPEDRDYVFVNFNGLLPSLARGIVPHMVGFGEEIPGPEALSHNTFEMDRRLLADLPRATWDSVAAHLQSNLSDSVIATAVALLPAAYQRQGGSTLVRTLQARRQRLPAAAREWYRWLSTEVDVHGTDAAEYARAEYLDDGSVRVRLFAGGEGGPEGEPFFERRFWPDETGEVRLYLHGGDDRAVVRAVGRHSPIVVRVIGGEGDDVLADSSEIGAGPRVTFHDGPGEENVFTLSRRSAVDTVPFAPPAGEDPISGARYRDFGTQRATLPIASYGSTLGLVVGAGIARRTFGFRQVPHASEMELSGAYSFRLNAVGLELNAERRRSNSPRGASLVAAASQLQPFYYFGAGNLAPAPENKDEHLVEQDLLLVQPALDYRIGGRSHVSFGPVLKFAYRRPRPGSAAAAAADGSSIDGGFGQLGGQISATVDFRDTPNLPRSGLFASLGGSAFAAAWSASELFGKLRSEVAAYLTLPADFSPTLALRGGVEQAWGSYPLHESAFLGAWSSLRGYEAERFAGDAAVWGGAELRAPFLRANLIVRGDLGALGFVDAGRVYVDGQSPGGWHTGRGAGLYFTFDFQGAILSSTVLYARGETDKLRMQLGLPF